MIKLNILNPDDVTGRILFSAFDVYKPELCIFMQKDIYGSPCDILFKASIRAFSKIKITVFKVHILNI